ncbi:MAG: 50S ribosomal protein L24 [Candidatus Zixiibacteriota bacterium]|nr:MAG: 50S ribosomal protein L24 [candidate division Zixibacteria bacterium]
MRIRKGDMVVIRTGTGKEKKGPFRVLHVDTKKQVALVEGVNMKKRHQKPTQKNPKGGIVTIEAPIHLSNLALYSSTLSGPTKVSTAVIDEGGKKVRVRVCRKTGEQI